ncbi:DUF502 domain-containing protein [Tateyamaria omphalii]|uniref:DUF502 domain-containing protein n=1 Tax=Tateyamaria omphalii TaxID=299262 RepID=A0A1P8MU48_9RHOB|nr:DUF502 domain-containing protein [Tateyamaria omphalii]APX11568.1 hypothetical protein BWR18_07635 [Tateyamaria omphalii]
MNTPFDPETPRRPGLFSRLRASFLTGIVVIAPVGLTVWLIWTVIGWVDGFVWPLVPAAWQPDSIVNFWLNNPRFIDQNGVRVPNPDWIHVNVRGVGVIVFLLFTIFVGWIAKGFIGRSLIRWAESLVERTPVVRSIYSGIKQISETIFAQSERSFEKACLIEYPRKGIWAIGFISTTAKGEVSDRAGSTGALLSIFVPTTPNPTSGFLLFFPAEDVIELDMSVEDAAKLVISAGLVYPNGKDPTKPPS